MQKKFDTLIAKHEASLIKDSRSSNILGYIKLTFVLLTIILVYFTVAKEFTLNLIILSAASLIILVVLWVYHERLHNKITYSKGIVSICNQHIDRVTGKWTTFKDIGAEFINQDHVYACDLDIVGKKSIFQFLNTTNTWHGRQAFSSDLLRPMYTGGEIKKRQEAISELSGDIELSSKIQYYFSRIGVDSSAVKLVDELKDNSPFMNNKSIKILLKYLPVFTVMFTAAITVFQQKDLYITGLVIVVIQAILWLIGMTRIYKYLGVIVNTPYKLSAYCDVIKVLTCKNFMSEKLVHINNQLSVATQAINDLGKIASRVSVRHNIIIYFIANVFLLWDYECVFLLEGWKRKYAHEVERWFLAMGELESLLCFSHMPNVCNNVCLPEIVEKVTVIETVEMGHPLLQNEVRVNNNLSFSDSIYIVSGSNMSGKTTFLRTVGVNLVLARLGGFVCAKKMMCSQLDVVTSMRIADDLNEGISTFYAELKRIKIIIDMAQENKNIMFLIDEIFRGTNSVDRLTGARGVVTRLNDLGALGFISTHDLELCQLANTHSRIENYSFSESYVDNKIHFDYKVKQGKSNSTNAEFLMKMVGIMN